MTGFPTDHHRDDDVHELADLYAVDALDADDAERFARHLPGCPACQRDVTELHTASTALALATALPLPPAVRQRVLAEVARQPQIAVAPGAAPVRPADAGGREPSPAAPPAPRFDPAVTRGGDAGPSEGGPGRFDPAVSGGGGAGPSEGAPAPLDRAATGVGEVVRLDEARRRRRPGRGTGRNRLLAVASAAVVVLAGAAGALAVARSDGRVGSEGGDRAAVEAAFAAVEAAPDARTVTLTGGEPGARVRLAWSAAQDRVVLLADGVPDPGPGRTYELWRIDAAGPDPAGLFEPDGSGGAGLVAPLDGGEPSAWGVTVEPDGGSPAPTPPIVYQAEA